MTQVRAWIDRLRGTLRPRRGDLELQEELRLHLQLAAEEAQRRGDSPEDAARTAAIEAGGVAQAMEALRDQRGFPGCRDLGRDVHYACRGLLRNPGLSVVAVASLALGIGANTAIFSLVNSLLLRALPVRSPEQLVLLGSGTDARIPYWSSDVWDQLRQRPQLFDGTLAWATTRFNLSSSGETQLVDGVWASDSYFDVLGVPAILGRTFSSADDQAGGGPRTPVAVISYGFWQRHFGGTPTAIGRTLTLDQAGFTIIGVTPPEFFGTDVGRTFDVAVPLGFKPLTDGPQNGPRRQTLVQIMARLKPGTDIGRGDRVVTRRAAADTGGYPAQGMAEAVSRSVSQGRADAGACGHRQFEPAAPISTAASYDPRGWRAGPADRVCERRQSAARACHGPASRVQRAARLRCLTLAPDATTAH